MLLCPAVTHADGLGRDGLESYTYEFESRPLTNALARGLGLTLRNWRQLQMGRLGSDVPLVRCLHHTPALNLAFGGSIYESGADWEDQFASLVNKSDLTLEAALLEYVHLEVTRIPALDSVRPIGQLELTPYYNRSFKGSSDRKAENIPIELSDGPTTVGGVAFDARGIVQLGSRNYDLVHCPAAVSNIVVRLACRTLVFLHGAIKEENQNTSIGQYRVHFDDGTIETVPVVYGRHVLDWQTPPPTNSWSKFQSANTVVYHVAGLSSNTWLYSTRWLNPHPALTIDHLDFLSLMNESSPFLVAISAEEVKPAAPLYDDRAHTGQSNKTEVRK
jgi:hypothetical protein